MSVVNRYPQGLLALLESKTVGRTPSEVEEKLRISIDANPFYLSTVALRYASGFEATNTGGNITAALDIPAGETWQVVAVHTQIDYVTTNDVALANPVILAPESATASTAGPSVGVAIGYDDKTNYLAAAGESRQVPGFIPYPLILKAPVRFATNVTRIAATTVIQFTTGVLYYQLD